jgi:hypothetical protein
MKRLTVDLGFRRRRQGMVLEWTTATCPGGLRGDGEVDKMRCDAGMSNVRLACSRSSWNNGEE